MTLAVVPGGVPIGEAPTTIFPNSADAVADLRGGTLMLAASRLLPGVSISDGYVYDKLLAAEKEVAHALRTFTVPTYIIPDDATQEETDALDEAGAVYAQESSYDYGPSLYDENRWGFIVAKSRPIISVSSIRMVAPSTNTTFFDVPADWIRLDRKYGHVRLVPASSLVAAPLAGFMMTSVSNGREVPMMLQMRYTAGLRNAAQDWPDLVDVIKRKAVLKIMLDSYVPQSGSISADGLSRSMSVDLDKYGESINEALFGPKGSNGGLMAAIHGVRMGVF